MSQADKMKVSVGKLYTPSELASVAHSLTFLVTKM